MIDTVIFDFDGVIIDTETPDFLTWQAVFESHGVDLEMDVWLRHVGGKSGAFRAHDYLERATGKVFDKDKLQQNRRSQYVQLVESYPLMPGILDYIFTCQEIGIHVGLASSSPMEWVQGHLKRMGILQHFECIRSADDVRYVKPKPDLYLACLEFFNTNPEHSVAIEDSLNGLSAAKSAGMYCVAVPNSITRNFVFQDADCVLESLADIPLRDLIQRLEKLP
jgi:HAD superfamily hydrolase (TIGR01509 family)